MDSNNINKLLLSIGVIQDDVNNTNENELKVNLEALKKHKQLLSMLTRNEQAQKTYPKYLKLYKLYTMIPDLVATIVGIILMSMVIFFVNSGSIAIIVPLISFIVAGICYATLEKSYSKKIKELEPLKVYYEELGEEPYNKETVQSKIEELGKQIKEVTDKIDVLHLKVNILNSWHILERKLFKHLDGEQYNSDLTKLETSISELKDKEIPEKDRVYAKR